MAARSAKNVWKGLEEEDYGEDYATSEEENFAEVEQESSSTKSNVEDDVVADQDFEVHSDMEESLQEMKMGTSKKRLNTYVRTGNFAVLLSFRMYKY